jgi:hypothetical protein
MRLLARISEVARHRHQNTVVEMYIAASSLRRQSILTIVMGLHVALALQRKNAVRRFMESDRTKNVFNELGTIKIQPIMLWEIGLV